MNKPLRTVTDVALSRIRRRLKRNYLTESWTPANLPDDWQIVRNAWNRANLLCTTLCSALFGLGLLALIQRARIDIPSRQPRCS